MAFNVLQIALQGAPTNGASEVVSLSMTGTVASGTFTLTFGGQTTSALAFNASAPDVQTALLALSSVGAGNLTCTGGSLPATPITISFGGVFEGVNVGNITSADSLVGVTPATAITASTSGVHGSYRGIVTGAKLIDEVNGKIYSNTGTPAVPVWTEISP